MRNIANVVHDLTPIVESALDKLKFLSEVKCASEFIKLSRALESDLKLQEEYLKSLSAEASENKITKAVIKPNP